MRGNLVALFLLPSLAIHTAVCKADDEVVTTIDAQALLAKNFGITLGKAGRKEECLPLEEHSGFQAKKVPCEIFTVMKNIKIDQLFSIKRDQPKIDDIDAKNESRVYTLKNCLSKDSVFDRTVKIHTDEHLKFTTNTVVTNVSEASMSFSVDASFFKLIGGKYGEGVKETVTHSLNEGQEYYKDLGRDIDEPLHYQIPSHKKYIISIRDVEKGVTIPIHISAVLTAEVYQEIRALNGNVIRSTKIRTIAESDADKRTVTVDGKLYYQGSTYETDRAEYESEVSKDECIPPEGTSLN
ncbi:hypothetical protein [Rhizobium leucaenae]|uniref:Uncharacterized protein n=1 Tax=Rhizobium leucaenae TaxID=29450 RepID=A0A7W7A002_9HYPH|nr:hypothetical protein [Rhizobium leucaenae]MBB4571437.1 hypothetical protein [Rhizobium leucaenae]